mgnify:CR=1 FL=1
MQISTESIEKQIPYYLTQEAKENLAKALARFPRQIDYYINRYQNEILQGDGWNSVEVINFENGKRKLVRAVLLSNSCDVDPKNKRELPVKLTFAPIIKLNRYLQLLKSAGLDEQQVEAKAAAIKEQNITTLFYLPKGANLGEDFVALLGDVHSIPYQAFDALKDNQKIFTLSQVGFYLFIFKLSVHFCRLHEEVDRS